MFHTLKIANEWLKTSDFICLAVVTKTWGSAPRRKGSLMIIHPEGHFEGSVSGGCVEGSVISEALTLDRANHKKLTYAVSNDEAWEVGLACGGEIEIQLFKISSDNLPIVEASLRAIETRTVIELILDKKGNAHQALPPSNSEGQILIDADNNTKLLIAPRNRMLIIGAVHIAQHLAPIAIACDYEVIIIDPRASFTENRNFSGATIINDWPDEYVKASPIDQATAIVTLTHDPKIDDAILRPALISKAFYIGALGSKKTHASRLDRIKGFGFSPHALARINGPIGLNIGAANPAEIAVSIMAEVTDTLRTNSAV
ncbi:XdhC family protein [Kordiimonas laminariae]|uniref:XdhC family protein n=1 Tax=Kordiimonas laminariae TaxID=2917717 RepID=UPI00248CA3E4|nr:XdhC family protein [Kordiimonas laminariae]